MVRERERREGKIEQREIRNHWELNGGIQATGLGSDRNGMYLQQTRMRILFLVDFDDRSAKWNEKQDDSTEFQEPQITG